MVFNNDQAGEILSASFTYIMSGPPLKSMAEQNPDLLTPIGLLNNVTESGQRPSVSLTEFGANYRQPVAGAPSYNATLQRVTSYSANLLGMLYRWAVNLSVTAYSFPPNADQSGGDPDTRKSLQLVTFSSDILDVPFGIYICKATEDGRFISGVYWEGCLVLGKGSAVPAGEAVILESVQIAYTREWPVPQLVHFVTADSAYTFPSAGDDATLAAGGTFAFGTLNGAL